MRRYQPSHSQNVTRSYIKNQSSLHQNAKRDQGRKGGKKDNNGHRQMNMLKGAERLL